MNKFSIIISSPSGGGKTTMCKKLISNTSSPIFNNAKFSISATTRSIRKGEAHGVDYHFLTESAFMQKIKNDEFLEYANVFGKMYGTLKSELSQTHNTIFDIDVEGHRQIKEKNIDCLSIFLLPPSLDVLKKRIQGRGDLSNEDLIMRLSEAQNEINKAENYDFILVNKDVDTTFQTICDIIKSYAIKLNSHLLNEEDKFENLIF